jgi:sugar-phosphatase
MMQVFTCGAVLFDMDGTLVDSTRCVETLWRQFAELHQLDISEVLAASHGRRTIDTLREVAPHLDAAKEAAVLDTSELGARDGIVAVEGAAALLESLPSDRWAVVTSAGRTLAEVRLRGAGLPVPKVLISADDVTHGKPDPEGYLKAAAVLGVAPHRCLVVEDTPPGLTAGRAAGMEVLGITTTYPCARLLGVPCVADLCEVRIRFT